MRYRICNDAMLTEYPKLGCGRGPYGAFANRKSIADSDGTKAEAVAGQLLYCVASQWATGLVSC